ncbi:family 16 glycosylhydrolase [Candidatus Saccharibacteria bacterium]|nr:family 16 glycosylhydrolase [Candidatus Saccharibacteria bacterium]
MKRKSILLFASTVLLFSVFGSYSIFVSKAETPVATAATWGLYWSDEFNGTSLDTSRWSPYYNTYGDGNNEEACLTPNNITVNGGSMKMVAKRESITCPGKPTDQFSSGFMGSREVGKYYPAFAKYEIRAKVPHGQGLWPAFWLRHTNGSSTAEVDIMEYFHTQNPGSVQQTLHLPAELSYNLAHQSKFFETPVLGSGAWHSYSVEIIPLDSGTRAQFNYYVDGILNYSYTPTKFGWLNNYNKNAMFDIAINMAVGGNWSAHPDDPFGWSRYLSKCINKYPYKLTQPCDSTGVIRAQFPATYEVDYVRVYTADAPVSNNADLNGDLKVNIQDLSILISKWATNSQPADINKDGVVNVQDLSILISKWTG